MASVQKCVSRLLRSECIDCLAYGLVAIQVVPRNLQQMWSNTPFSAKARNHSSFKEKEGELYCRFSGKIELHFGTCCQKMFRCIKRIFASQLLVWSWLTLQKSILPETTQLHATGSLLKDKNLSTWHSNSVTANFLLVMILEELENVVVYVGLNSWKNFQLYDGHNHLMCHKLPISGLLA